MSDFGDRDSRLNEILAGWYEQAEAGRAPDREEFLACHAEYAVELASFFAAKDEFEPTVRAVGGPLVSCLPEGGSIVGDYELLEELGRGGMGVVHRARDLRLGRVVALKMVRAGRLASVADMLRFRAEAVLVASLDHLNVVPVYEVGECGGQPFFAMKLVEGESLAAVLSRSSVLGQRDAARLMTAVARAVHHAHQRGVLHRDLKPANVLLDADGQPHVTDFGLARRIDRGRGMTETGVILGTASYMSPEQADAQKGLSVASDVFSLGAVLYECLTGRPPFAGGSVLDTLRRLREEEPTRPRTADRDLATVCLKCLEKDPQRRYESAAALADDLDRWLAGEPISARPVGPVRRLARWGRRNPALAALVVVVLSLLTTVAVGATLSALSLYELAGKERAAKDDADERRRDAEAALERAEGLRLTALSSAQLPSDPALALLLALEGSQRAPGLLNNNALLSALNACTEERAIFGPACNQVRFTPDGRRVLGTTSAGAVLAWDVATGQKLVEHSALWQRRNTQLDAVPLAADGSRFAVFYRDTWSAEHTHAGPPGRTTRFLYTDTAVRVGNVATGKQLAVLRGHKGKVVAAAFSLDGRRLVTASHDGTARIWDASTGKPMHTLKAATNDLAAATFSPDGKRVLTVTSQFKSSQTTPQHHPPADDIVDPRDVLDPSDPKVVERYGPPYMTGVNSNGGFGQNLAEVVYARVFDAATGKQLASVEASPIAQAMYHRRFPRFGMFAPSGERFFLGVEGFTHGELRESATGRVVWTIKDGDARSALLGAFSPDGSRLALLTADMEPTGEAALQIHDAVTGQEQLRVRGLSPVANSLTFSPDGAHVLLAAGRVARVWNAASGREVASLRGPNDDVTSAAFSPDGRRVVMASRDGTIRISNVHGESRRHFVEIARPHGQVGSDIPGHPRRVQFSPDGKRLATLGDESAVRLWDVATGRPVGALRGLADLPERRGVRERILGEARSAQFTPNGDILALTRRMSATVVKDGRKRPVPFTPATMFTPSGRPIATYAADRYQVQLTHVSNDGRHVVTVEAENTNHQDFDSNWTGGFVGGHGFTDEPAVARLYDARTGKPRFVLRDPGIAPAKHPMSISGAAFSPDGKEVATVGRGKSTVGVALRVWSVETGRVIRTLMEDAQNGDLGHRVAWCPNGRTLLVHYGRVGTKLFDARSGALLAKLEFGQSGGAESDDPGPPAFSPDGRRLACLDDKNRVLLIDPRTGQQLAVAKGHSRAVHRVRFSGDSSRLVSTSDDETARVWDAATGQEVVTLTGHRGAVVDAAFSPDGSRVATASKDGSVRVWRLDLATAAWERLPRALTDDERARFEVPTKEGR